MKQRTYPAHGKRPPNRETVVISPSSGNDSGKGSAMAKEFFSPPSSPKLKSEYKDVLDPGFIFFHLRQMSPEKAKCKLCCFYPRLLDYLFQL